MSPSLFFPKDDEGVVEEASDLNVKSQRTQDVIVWVRYTWDDQHEQRKDNVDACDETADAGRHHDSQSVIEAPREDHEEGEK